MPATTNLLQWNPSGTNMESDTLYSVDTQRTTGASNPAIFTSATANKLFYQLSTFMSAFAQALVAKGYSLSDANLSTLAGVLANVVTNVDLAAALALYAPLASPVFSGSPANLATGAVTITPTAGDSSTKVPNTFWVANNFAALPLFANSIGAAGYQKFPGGLILQWGVGAISGQTTLTGQPFAMTFPNYCFAVIGGFGASITTSPSLGVLGFDAATLGTFNVTFSASATTSPVGFRYIALGY